MASTKIKQQKENLIEKKESISIDEAFNVLDRTIGFINNCDNKASIILGCVMTVVAIIFSTEGITKIHNIISTIVSPTNNAKPSAAGILYLIFLFIFSIVLAAGLISLVLVLISRTKPKIKGDTTCGNSKIYFGHISQLNNAKEYKKCVLTAPRDNFLEDILNQIYVNSMICSKKHMHYNRGLRCTLFGLGLLMATYDYSEGLKRIRGILDNKLEVAEDDSIPNNEKFTFENGYYGWVTGVFVDIRNSSALFCDEDKVKISKIIRSFTFEIIEILRLDDVSKNDTNLREIGIRGDCVYTTPNKSDIYEIADKTFFINTYLEMLNKLLSEKGYPNISVGIGMATAEDLVVKAGRSGVGINNKVWIGSAVTTSSNLSSLGNKNSISSLVYSSCAYINFIEQLIENSSQSESWFKQNTDAKNGTYYHANIIITGFNNWINEIL